MAEFIELGSLDQIPDPGSKGYRIGDHSLFAVRQGSRVFVYLNRCPHLGIELEWLPDKFLDAHLQFIQCAMHGALFLIESGECISGPCLGDHLEPCQAQVRDGRIQVIPPAAAESPGADEPA